VQQFVERLNDLNSNFLYHPKLDEDEIIDILDQDKLLSGMRQRWLQRWLQTLTFFKCPMKNLFLTSMVWRTLKNPMHTWYTFNATSRLKNIISCVGIVKNHANQWCHYCDKNNHKTPNYQTTASSKQGENLILKLNLLPERSSWPYF